MFCSHCGTKLPDDARYCFRCGVKVDSLNIGLDVKINKDIVKKFSLFGGYVYIDTKVENTISLRKIFQEFSNKFEKNIEETYYSLGNMIDVSTQLPSIGLAMLEESITKCVEILIDNKIYNIDNEIFKKNYYDIDTLWNERCQHALSDYIKIMIDYQTKIDNHNEWSSSQGNWIGGGFGLEGAIKGFATSIALNVATDLIADVIGSTANNLSKYKTMQKLEEVYNEPKTIDKFKIGIHKVTLGICSTLINILIENGLSNYYSVDREDESTAIVLNNMYMIEDKERVLLDLLNEYPFSSKIINYAYENDIGNKQDLKSYADFFNMDIVPIKILTHIEKSILEIDYNDITMINNTKRKVIDICSKYDIDKKSYISWFDNIIEKIKSEPLEFDGMSYDNIEEVLEAKRILSNIIKITSNTFENDWETIMNCIDELDKSNMRSKNKYIDYLYEILNDFSDESTSSYKKNFFNSLDNKQEMSILQHVHKIITTSTFDDINELLSLKEYIIKELNYKSTENYIRRLNRLIDIYDNSISYAMMYEDYPFLNRLEYTNIILEGEKILKLMNEFNLKNEKFEAIYINLKKDFMNVYGKECQSITDAIDSYAIIIKRAKSYQNSLKNTKKDNSFLCVFKSSNNYEDEYNRVTQNGRYTIPDDILSDIKEMKRSRDRLKRDLEKTISNIKEIDISTLEEMKYKKLDIKHLMTGNSLINMEDVISEASKYIKGSILKINFHDRTITSNGYNVMKQIKIINEYYHEDLETSKINDICKKDKIYIITYKNWEDIETAISNLKDLRIEIEFLKY
ncbi:MAG: zinc ribbon domain-containing protein [Faecalibacillus sp.]